MSDISTVLARPDIEIIAITTRAGQVYTIGPAHVAYAKIKKLAISRQDDEKLLSYIVGELDAPTTDTRVRPLCALPRYDSFTTNGHDVWFGDTPVPEAIASELLFLADCIVERDEPKDLSKVASFAEYLTTIDEEIAEELVSLHVKHLIELDDNGQIHTRHEGLMLLACSKDDADDSVAPSHVREIRRRRGSIALIVDE